MGIKTEIACCDSTVNPVVGCDGCELSGGHCYAESLVGRYAGLKGWPKQFKQPEFVDRVKRMDKAARWSDLRGKERPDKPWLNGMPRMIFVCDLADPFSESLPSDWLLPHVVQWVDTPHIWLLLTKRPKRFAEFVTRWEDRFGSRFPQNIWGGTSVTSQETAWKADELGKITSLAVRFVSAEPLLGEIDVGRCLHTGRCKAVSPLTDRPFGGMRCGDREGHDDEHSVLRETGVSWFDSEPINWIIAGGESGPKARPCHPDWVRSLRDQCQASHVPFFFKQWGEFIHSTQLCTDLLCERASVRPQIPDGDSDEEFIRVGKSSAGRLLDGREWNEMP